MLRIDAHHHLWQYNPSEYGWLNGDLAILRRNFLPVDLEPELHQANVAGTVVVQARQTMEETDWLISLAKTTPFMLGVIGWLPLREPNFPAVLNHYSEHSILKGLRHVVQDEPAGFMDDPAFNNGIRTLRDTGWVYDLLIAQHQLEEATRFVDRHPHQPFVLDHLAKPCIAAREFQPWTNQIRELARRENVVCKLSGMVTEADPQCWSADLLRPYFDVVLECFTPARLMAATDWPVLCAGCPLQRWWELLAQWVSPLSADEQADVMGCAAIRTYGLTPPSAREIQSPEVAV
jgi:L-fuconolactonase